MFFQNSYSGRNQWWRWVLLITALIIIIILAQVPLLEFLEIEAERLGVPSETIFNNLPEETNRNLFLALFLLPFVVGFFTFWLLLRLFHGKSLRAVMTGRQRFDWKRASTGFLVWFAILGVITFSVLPAQSYSYQFKPENFLILLPVALLMFPIQTTFEEVFFRGYLMQGIFLLAKSKMISLIVITLLFALIHFENPEFSNDGGFGALEYLLMSAFLGLITVLDDGLELACGIHAANNIFLSLILTSSDGSIQTDGIFVTSMSVYADHFLLLSILPYLVGFALLFTLYRWRFGTLLTKVPSSSQAQMNTGD